MASPSPEKPSAFTLRASVVRFPTCKAPSVHPFVRKTPKNERDSKVWGSHSNPDSIKQKTGPDRTQTPVLLVLDFCQSYVTRSVTFLVCLARI